MAKRAPDQKGICRRADEIGVTHKTAFLWSRDGVDVFDDEAVRRHVAQLKKVPPNLADKFKPKAPEQSIPAHGQMSIEEVIDQLKAAPDYNTTRFLKTKVEGLQKSIALRESMKAMVPIAKVRENFLRIGAAVKAAIMRMEADLPPMLAGMSETQIQPVIRGKGDEVLTALADGESEFWREQEDAS